ncbi:MAG TPA: hypothetical protein DD444_23470 [Citreicella sp.]|nr:hypothetical protein [Citreicella sp.]
MMRLFSRGRDHPLDFLITRTIPAPALEVENPHVLFAGIAVLSFPLVERMQDKVLHADFFAQGHCSCQMYCVAEP